MPRKKTTRDNRNEELHPLSTSEEEPEELGPPPGELDDFSDASYISRLQAAKELGINARRLDRQAQLGHIRSLKKANTVYFHTDDLRRYRSDKPLLQSLKAATGERMRQDDMKFQEISERLKFLERVLGISARSNGLNRPVLVAMSEDSIRKVRQVGEMSEEEKASWMNRLTAFDYGTIKFCLNDPELAHLPLRVLKIGEKIANSRKTIGERNEDLINIRHFKLTLQSFSSPLPVYYCSFPLLPEISTLDALILACHLKQE